METTIIQIDEGWKHVQRGVRKLERLLEGLPESQFTAEEYMFLYSTIYDMCTQKPPNDYSKELYDRYKTTINTYIQKTVLPSLDNQHNNEFMLREVGSSWLNHKVFVKWLGKFFNYLDRFFISRRSLPTLNQVGLQCFRDQIFVQAWSGRVRDVVIYVINQEREGVQIDRALLKNVLDIFIEIGLGSMDCYERDFEAHMLTDTWAYYSRKAASWILEDSCPDYIRKVEERLRQEKERVNNYLHSTTEPKVLEIVERELLIKYQYQILEKENSGCDSLLRDNKKDDVCRLYKLFCRIPNGIEPVSFAFKQHITAQGSALVKQAEDAVTSKKVAAADKKLTVVGSPDQDFIKQLIAMLDKYVSYVTDCFQESSLFHKALKESFEVFCNKTVAGATTAELLATYSDNLLKKGAKDKMTDEAVEETLEKVVKILGYISDKDLFAEFYRKKLARRLIHERSASDDHDRSFLIKLRQQCGAQFTSKMEGMLNDIVLAKEHQAGYEHYVKESNSTVNPGVDFSVSILTTGFWPSYKFFDVNLPSEMVKCVTAFKEYYSNKTKQRKLTWIYSHGICNLNARFDTKSIELVVTTFQAITLMLFNTSQRLSYSEIRTQLNIMDDDIIRLLHSLSCGKYKILSKEPNTKSISHSDYFEFNSKFTDKMRKIKIPLPPVSEQKKVIEDVQSDRRHAIDASLVRIMKSRKVMGHQQLVTECVEQLSRMFKPDFKVIKKRIEDLITREYLERDQENPHVFKYLA